MEHLERFLEWGGVRKDVACLVLSGLALLLSLAEGYRLPIDPAWLAVLLCGVPIVLEAVIGLVTAFDIKADVLVSIALAASIAIGETFKGNTRRAYKEAAAKGVAEDVLLRFQK